MKRFIFSVLSVSVFFIGLGTLADKVGAKFKSDEKALDIIAKARVAIGGDGAISDVRSMVIKGQTSRTFKIDGAERTETGDSEIALQLPDKMMKMIKIGKTDGAGEAGEVLMDKQIDVVVMGGRGEGHQVTVEGNEGAFTTSDGKTVTMRRSEAGDVKELSSGDHKIIVRKTGDGNATWTSEDGKTLNAGSKKGMIEKVHSAGHHGGMRQNELLRTTLSLLLTAPEGVDVEYTFGGESEIDGTSCNVVNAAFGGTTYKLFISKSSNLPVAMSYTGHRMPQVMKFRHDAPAGGEPQDVMVFTKKLEGPGDAAEFVVHFADYRSSGGVQLPYKWTTTVGGATEEVFDVTSYEVNPANIADRFKDQKVFVRSAKPVEN